MYRAAQRGDITIHKAGNRALLRVAEVVKWIEDDEKKKFACGANCGAGKMRNMENRYFSVI